MLAITLPGTLRLSVTPDNRVFYGEEDTYFQQLTEFEELFTSNTKVAFVVTCSQPIELCPDLVSSIAWLSEASLVMPFLVKIDSLSTYPTLISTPDSITSYSTLDYVCPKAACNQALLSRLEDSKIQGRYIDASRKTLSVLASLDIAVGSVDAVSKSYAASIALVDQHKARWPDLDIRYVGTVPLMQAFVDATNKDLTSVLALAILVILVLLAIFLQSIRLVLVMLALGLLTIAATLGIAGWTGLVLNTATATIPLVLFTLIIASSMHLFMYLLRASSEQPSWSSIQAAEAAFNSQWKPVILTSATTSACLLSLLTVDSPPVQDIGLWTAVGMIIGTAILLIVVPVYAATSPRPNPSIWQQHLQTKLNAYARFLERDSSPTKLVIAFLIASGALIFTLQVDDDFVRYFEKDNQFRSDTEYVAEHLFGPSNMEIQLDSTDDDSIFDPAYVDYMARLSTFLRDHPLVKNVVSFSDVIEETNKHFGGGQSLTQLDQESIAQMFMAYEFSLELGQTTNDLVDSTRRYARASTSLMDIPSLEVTRLESDIYDWHKAQDSPYGLLVTGESIPISHLSTRNIRSMLLSIILTFIVTSIVLALVFRNARVGFVALVSTFVPVVIGFGLWSLGSSTVGLSTTVILSVCIGVVIDDSIHLIYRHFDALRHLDLSTRQAAAYSVHRVGSAIITTTIVMVAGFMILMLSDFQLNSTFAACSSLILLSALLFDLLISPKMLVWASPGPPHRDPQ